MEMHFSKLEVSREIILRFLNAIVLNHEIDENRENQELIECSIIADKIIDVILNF